MIWWRSALTVAVLVGVTNKVSSQDGAVGNTEVATMCAEAKEGVRLMAFTVKSAVVEPERYASIRTEKLIEQQNRITRARRALEIVSGPATHEFLFASGDRLSVFIDDAKALLRVSGSVITTETEQNLEEFVSSAEEIQEELSTSCRADFLGKGSN